MKIIVLEHPRIPSKKRFNDIANTPLWSCLMGGYAAAFLEEKKFNTLFWDHAQPNASFDYTMDKILTINPDLLCVNTVYFWEHTSKLFEFFSTLKNQGFSGHINLFGFFPSLVYRKILHQCNQVDSIAVGEFEHTLGELAQALEKEQSHKKSLALEKIEGLATSSCLSDNKNRMRQPEKTPDIFAFPKRNSRKGTAAVLTSRGCYNHCSFCPVPSFYNRGKLWKGRSPENIADEIQQLVNQGVKDFYFVDPNFIGPGKSGKKRIMDLMDLLKPMEIKFGMETRPQDLDDTILEKLVNSGFKSLLMGVESGSTAVLNQINKSSKTITASQAISLCRKYGVEPEIGFLMFVPDSSLENLLENMDFLIKNNLLDRLDRTANLLSHTQIVLAGTSGYDRFEKENRLEKMGIFEFEAEVTFKDPRVKWVADLITFACHTLLKDMSDSHSPIFWQNENEQISQRANTFLVDLAFNLLSQAKDHQRHQDHTQTDPQKKEILEQIFAILT
ncbi:MAG: B12-binding domain-containing radical SAM protein [Desulfobacteraceae bacterium]|nr:B12-binding domain-containing radical SAM protein [Desulfobacteraceae bacterium]